MTLLFGICLFKSTHLLRASCAQRCERHQGQEVQRPDLWTSNTGRTASVIAAKQAVLRNHHHDQSPVPPPCWLTCLLSCTVRLLERNYIPFPLISSLLLNALWSVLSWPQATETAPARSWHDLVARSHSHANPIRSLPPLVFLLSSHTVFSWMFRPCSCDLPSLSPLLHGVLFFPVPECWCSLGLCSGSLHIPQSLWAPPYLANSLSPGRLDHYNSNIPQVRCLSNKPVAVLSHLRYKLRGLYSSFPTPPTLYTHSVLFSIASVTPLVHSHTLISALAMTFSFSPFSPSLYWPQVDHSLTVMRMRMMRADIYWTPDSMLSTCMHFIKSLQQPHENRCSYYSDFAERRKAQRALQGWGLPGRKHT